MLEIPPQSVTMRPCTSTYVVFGVIFGIVLVPLLATGATRRPGGWGAVGVSLLGLTLSFTWIAYFKLVIAHGFISYRTLFTGTRSIAVSEIERCDVEIGYDGVWNKLRPPIRLVIRPRESTGRKPIYVNLKVLSKPDVLWLLKVLAPQAHKHPLVR